ncbi:MAG: hypothetical protein RL538_842 [Candidatus Parcubacteria bacterium]|jgi:hypothetical protein
MRAKNGFHCSLASSYPYSLKNVREALSFYSEEFECAVASGKLLRFDLTSHDEKMLQTFYTDDNLLVPGSLFMLLNDALDDSKMPYAVLNVMRVIKTPRFYCRIIRFNWHKEKQIESK